MRIMNPGVNMRRTTRSCAIALVAGASMTAAADGTRIRATFAPGQDLHYRWHMEATNTWDPPIPGADSGTMKTDFDFHLVAERMEALDCLFRVDGRSLESIAEGKKGALGISASPREAKLLLGKRWLKPGPKTPLKERITVTLGPRFNVTGSSGLQHLALYFLPSVDGRVWLALMTAPELPLEPGQEWSQKFTVPVKELGDRPLDIGVDFRIEEASDDRGRRTLIVNMSGKLALADFDVKLKKGQTLHVARGTYTVFGRTDWDVARGIPTSVEADQWIEVVGDQPATKLEHHAWSRLALVD